MACRTQLIRRLALLAAAPTLLAATSAYAGDARAATLHPDHVGATGSGFQHGGCPDVAGWGWHFVVPGNGDFVTLSVKFAKAGTVSLGAGDFGPPDASHAYVFTRSDDALLSGTASITGGKGKDKGNKDRFNLSHTCPGETEQPPTTPPATTPPPTTPPPTTTPPTATADPTQSPTSTPTVTPTVLGTKVVRGGTLPATGTSVVPVALLGCALVIVGGLAVVLTARRRELRGRH